MEHFSHKGGGCGICGYGSIKMFKRRAGLSYRLTGLQVISNTVLFKTVSYTTKKLKNKAIYIK